MAGIPSIPGVPQIDVFGNLIEPTPVDPYAPEMGIPALAPAAGGMPVVVPPAPPGPPGPYPNMVEAYEYKAPDSWFPDYLTGAGPDAVSGADEDPRTVETGVEVQPATQQAGPAALQALEAARVAPPPAVEEPESAVATQPSAADYGTGDPYLDSLQQTANMRMGAVHDQAEAEKAKNDFLADEQGRLNDQLAIRNADRESRRQENAKVAKLKVATLTQEATDLANTKVDEDAVWQDMSFGAKLFLGLAAALSGWADPRGRNKVVDVINEMVAKNMEAQKASLENRRAGLTMKKGLLSDELQAGRDEFDAQYKAHMAAYDIGINQLNADALRYNNPIIDAKTRVGIADIQDAKVEKSMQHIQKTEAAGWERVKDEENLALQRRQVGIQGYNARTSRMETEDRISARAAAEEVARNAPVQRNIVAERLDEDISRDKRERVVGNIDLGGGKPQVLGADSQSTMELRKRKQGSEEFIRTNRKGMEARAKFGNDKDAWEAWAGTSEGNQILNSLDSDLVAQYSVMTGQGAMAGKEKAEFLEAKTGGRGYLDKGAYEGTFRTNILQAEDSFSTSVRTFSESYTAPDLALDPKTQMWSPRIAQDEGAKAATLEKPLFYDEKTGAYNNDGVGAPVQDQKALEDRKAESTRPKSWFEQPADGGDPRSRAAPVPARKVTPRPGHENADVNWGEAPPEEGMVVVRSAAGSRTIKEYEVVDLERMFPKRFVKQADGSYIDRGVE